MEGIKIKLKLMNRLKKHTEKKSNFNLLFYPFTNLIITKG